MELFIIRHGESANNALADLRDREVDPPLTDLGKRQARLLAEHLATGATHDWVTDPASGTSGPYLRKGFGITSLFCSPMYRSMQTAELVGYALGLAPQVWIDIHEQAGMYLDHGGAEGRVGYPGRTRSEISAEFPGFQLPAGIAEEGWWNRGYEDMTTSAGRAIKVSEQLLGMAGSEERVAIITHGGIMEQRRTIIASRTEALKVVPELDKADQQIQDRILPKVPQSARQAFLKTWDHVRTNAS